MARNLGDYPRNIYDLAHPQWQMWFSTLCDKFRTNTPHISLIDTTTQTIAVANTPQIITFNTELVNINMTQSTTTNPGRITALEEGWYSVRYSTQLHSTNANKTLDIWARVDGVDVANTNTKNKVQNANDEKRTNAMFVVYMRSGQYFELWMSGDDTVLHIDATAAGVGPTRPLTPSIMFMLDKIW